MPFDYAVPSVPDGSRIDYSDRLLAVDLVPGLEIPAHRPDRPRFVRFTRASKLRGGLVYNAFD
jgi:hypothetical protein